PDIVGRVGVWSAAQVGRIGRRSELSPLLHIGVKFCKFATIPERYPEIVVGVHGGAIGGGRWRWNKKYRHFFCCRIPLRNCAIEHPVHVNIALGVYSWCHQWPLVGVARDIFRIGIENMLPLLGLW